MERMFLSTLLNLVTIPLTVFWWMHTYVILNILPRVVQTWLTLYIAFMRPSQAEPIARTLTIVLWGDRAKDSLKMILETYPNTNLDITVLVDTDDTNFPIPDETGMVTVTFGDAHRSNTMQGPILYLRTPLSYESLASMIKSMSTRGCDVVVSTMKPTLWNYDELFRLETRVPTGWYGFEAILSKIPLGNSPRSLVYRDRGAYVEGPPPTEPRKLNSWATLYSDRSGPLVRLQCAVTLANDLLTPHFWFATIYGLVMTPVQAAVLVCAFVILPHVVYLTAMRPSAIRAACVNVGPWSMWKSLVMWKTRPTKVQSYWFTTHDQGDVRHGHEYR